MPSAPARSPPRGDCVICFDHLSPPGGAEANPCLHASYHSHCLLQWLELNPSCPLCKTPVSHVATGPGGRTILTVPKRPLPFDPLSLWGRPAAGSSNTSPPRRRRHRRRRSASPATPPALESFPPYRLDIYRQARYSLHIGSNPRSGYRALTAATLNSPADLSRARAFIRRELLVLDALNGPAPATSPPHPLPPGATTTTTTTTSPQRSRAFRLEYIVAVLKAAGFQGASGAAEELVGRYLGRHTRLFLHELRSFLRSPFGRVEEWDRSVGYGPPTASP